MKNAWNQRECVHETAVDGRGVRLDLRALGRRVTRDGALRRLSARPLRLQRLDELEGAARVLLVRRVHEHLGHRAGWHRLEPQQFQQELLPSVVR